MSVAITTSTPFSSVSDSGIPQWQDVLIGRWQAWHTGGCFLTRSFSTTVMPETPSRNAVAQGAQLDVTDALADRQIDGGALELEIGRGHAGDERSSFDAEPPG